MSCCRTVNSNSAVVKDRGYAWVVLATCVIINYLCIGFLFGVIGVLTSEYEAFFDVKVDEATWVGSILFAVLFLSGPLVAFFIGKIGVRKVAVLAAIVHVIGFAVSGFAKRLWHVIPSFAVFCGIACCASHVCAIKILTVYFEKYQHMAYAVGAIGSDLAAVSFPFITTVILGRLPYKYAILSMAALLVAAIPCAASFIIPLAAESSPETDSDTGEKLTDGDLAEEICHQNALKKSETNTPLLKEDLEASNPNLLNNNIDPDEKLYDETTARKSDNQDTETHTFKDHIKVLTTPRLIIFIINCTLWNMGGSVNSILAYGFYLEKGYSLTTASLAMTMCGAGSTVGSLGVAIVAVFFSPNKLIVHWVSNLILGAGILTLPFLSSSGVAMTTCMTIIGFVYGVICANLGGIIEHLNGNNLLYLVYGYEMAAAGIGSFVGPIAAGHLEVQFGSGSGFYFGGTSALVALVIFLIYTLFDRSVLQPKISHSAEKQCVRDDSNQEELKEVTKL